MNNENNNTVFQCICGKQFETSKQLRSHKATCKIYQESVREEKLKKQQEKESRILPNGMFKCESCGKEHDGSYGSGRFCCKKCQCQFGGNSVKNRTPEKSKSFYQSIRAPYGTWKCELCNLIFETRAQLFAHNKKFHPFPKGSSWNKGLTKETDKRVAKYSKLVSESYKSGKIQIWCQGKKLSNEMKQKISNSMKKAHADGRANTYALSRHSNGCNTSYPEKWFIGVIKNNFNDQNYTREYPFVKYSLDFAWVDKKRCIEIDGTQHYDPRFPEKNRACY